MTRKIFPLVLVLCFCWPLDGFSALFKLEETVFQNGMTVVTVEDNSSPIITFQMFTEASVRTERIGITGISHFAEHFFMMGSKNVKPKEYAEIMARWGASWNAYTGLDYTTYHSTMPKERLDDVVALYADLIVNKTFPEDYFKAEMNVVHEERRLSDNNPRRSAYYDFQEILFEGSNYRFPVIGTWEDLKRITLDDVKRYYADYYSASNLVFVVAGDVTHSDVVASFMKWFGGVKGKETRKPKVNSTPPQKEEKRVVREREGIELPFVLIGYNTFNFDHPDYFPLQALSDILSDGQSSRFSQSLVRKKKLASSVYSYVLQTKDEGAFVIYAEPLKGVSMSVLERELYSEIEKLAQSGPGREEVDKVIAQTEKSFITDLQSTKTKADLVGRAYIISQNRARYYEDYLDNLRKVTPETVRDVARKYLRESNRNVLVNLPKGGSYWLTDLKSLNTKEYEHSKAVELPKGMRLFYQESREIPAVSVRVSIGAGSFLDPRGRQGLSSLTASLLQKGTTTRNEEEISWLLDSNAVGLSVSSDEEMTLLTLSFLKEKAALAFDILSDLLINFSPRESVINREKEIVISALEREKANPRPVGERALADVMFEYSGFAHAGKGYIESVKRISKKDIMKFYGRYFNAPNTSISVVGDIDLQYLVDLIGEKFLLYAEKGTVPQPARTNVKFSSNRFYVVDMPWITQSYVFAGSEGLPRSDKNYNVKRFANYILGSGGLSSRLMSNLRTDMGLAYTVRSYLNFYRAQGTFNFEIQTRTESTRKAVEAFLAEIRRFSAGITESEFLDSKSYFKGVLPIRMETIEQLSMGLIQAAFFGLDQDFLYKETEEMLSYGIDQINDEARRISQKNFVFVIVGDKKKISQELKGMGEIQEIKISDLY